MDERISTPEEFSLVARARSFTRAGRGVWLFFRTTHNAWLQLTIFLAAVAAGIYFSIPREEWVWLLLATGLVLAVECVNTAIEIDINLTSPEYHPYARDTKDVAAGAVLITSLIAALVGLLIFVPHVADWLRGLG